MGLMFDVIVSFLLSEVLCFYGIVFPRVIKIPKSN